MALPVLGNRYHEVLGLYCLSKNKLSIDTIVDAKLIVFGVWCKKNSNAIIPRIYKNKATLLVQNLFKWKHFGTPSKAWLLLVRWRSLAKGNSSRNITKVVYVTKKYGGIFWSSMEDICKTNPWNVVILFVVYE